MRATVVKKAALAACFVSMILVSAASADDLVPAPFRGDPDATYARWEFMTDESPVLADVEITNYGPAIAIPEPGVDQFWVLEWGGREGVWPLSGEVVIEIPNRADPYPYKEIWLQLTWAAQGPGVEPIVWADAPGVVSEAVVVENFALELTNEPPPAGLTWMHTTYSIIIEPNPPFETISISGAVMIDEIVVETICVPEPAGMALLAIGGLAVIRRRRA